MPPKHAAGNASGGLSKKQKTGPQQSTSKPQDRRAQVQQMRAIPAQPAETALKDGELDLQAFVAAHEFEIKSLEQSMATSQAVNNARAFQKVPRGLRRRTASHNAKRVPKRLRSRAQKEMKEDNTPRVEARKRKPRTTRARIRAEAAKKLRVLIERKKRRKEKSNGLSKGAQDGDETSEIKGGSNKSRPKIRRNLLNDPPKPPSKFRKRQLNKTWLPTHRWHAKRARMTEPQQPLWRFAIPLTPNEKIYRPTHRAHGDRGAMIWDMSYMSTIGLYGNPVGITHVLRRVGLDADAHWTAKGAKWRRGTRSCSCNMSRETKAGQRFMCPATIVWNPASPDGDLPDDPKKQKREVLVRLHPSAFLEVFNELRRLAKMENPQLYIEDLRFEIGSIELSGPASTEVLHSILTPYHVKEQPKAKHAEIFQSLLGLSNPAALPSNAILGFDIQDPRLRYPPRRIQLPRDDDADMKLLELAAEWPVEQGLRPYTIFDRERRHRSLSLPSQKFITRRRSKIAPGAFLKPSSYDPPIPILLMAARPSAGTQVQGTWTLLAPWKCILPLWYSIVHCPLLSGGNPRFAGVNEIRQVNFERGLPTFPVDFLGTNAGADWELEQRQQRYKAWQRRPKSKRTEWGSLNLGVGRKGEVGDGLACDFEHLFGLPKQPRADSDTEEPEEEGGRGDQDEDAMDIDEVPKETKRRPISSLHLLNPISSKTFVQYISRETPPELPPHAVINVCISLLTRGVVGPCARIYRLPSAAPPMPPSTDVEVPATLNSQGPLFSLPHNLRNQWLSRIPSPNARNNKSSPSSTNNAVTRICAASAEPHRKQRLVQELLVPPTSTDLSAPKPNSTDINGQHPVVPGPEDLVGFVTTGEFSLSKGQSMAIGSIAVGKIISDVRADSKEGSLCIVRNAGENVGWIAKWEAI